jgi:hypothetical protein
MDVLSVAFVMLAIGIISIGAIAIYLSLLVDKLHDEIDSLQPPF